MKAEILEQLVGGRDAADLDDTARTFAADVVARHLRAEAIERADWHRTQGHRLVIVSASLACYLRPIAQHLRFDAVLATELEVGTDGRLTGRMDGENVRGPEKARRLDAWIARECPGTSPFVWAYGDSSGDTRALGTRRPGGAPGPSSPQGHRLTPRSRYRADAGPLVGLRSMGAPRRFLTRQGPWPS